MEKFVKESNGDAFTEGKKRVSSHSLFLLFMAKDFLKIEKSGVKRKMNCRATAMIDKSC